MMHFYGNAFFNVYFNLLGFQGEKRARHLAQLTYPTAFFKGYLAVFILSKIFFILQTALLMCKIQLMIIVIIVILSHYLDCVYVCEFLFCINEP